MSFPSTLRRHGGSLLVDGFFRGLSRAGLLHPSARPERHGVEVLRDIPYLDTGRPEHRLDVYRPRRSSTEPVPVVLYVHGGGFRILSKDTHWVMGLAFARRGYLVFNIGYRLAPAHPYPAALSDACDALLWVQKNAQRWGGDIDRLALAGESAGANLVTALTLAACYSRPEPYAQRVFESRVRPRAVLPACGILQVSDCDRFKRRWPKLGTFVCDRLHEVSMSYLSGVDRSSPGGIDLADPLLVLERGVRPQRSLPPFMVTCGTKDPLIDDAQRLEMALERLGIECDTRYYPGEGHAFHALVWRASAKSFWRDTYRFLERHLSPAPSVLTSIA
jgi:acetyl esterase